MKSFLTLPAYQILIKKCLTTAGVVRETTASKSLKTLMPKHKFMKNITQSNYSSALETIRNLKTKWKHLEFYKP